MPFRSILRYVAILLAATAVFAEGPVLTGTTNDPIVPVKDLASIGVYYYPEAWPESQWERDIANIATFGFEYIHVAEFAWAIMEPQEGRYEFAWLDKVLALARKYGLKVILCTPTPTPPVWLTESHPDILVINANGLRLEHGSREQACWNVDTYRRYVENIVLELARRYGSHPAVWGWQIDNEVSHYGQYCFCSSCRTGFQTWLQQRYRTIDALNDAWGNTFWSQMYQRFDQIALPRQETAVQAINPHARLDMQRWFADSTADYVAWQAALLRRHSPGRWVTTNFMKLHDTVDPWRSTNALEVLTYTAYPVHGRDFPGVFGFRLGDGAELSFMNDMMRPVSPTFGVMELQPGQVNWGDINSQPLPGAVRLWIHHTIASGARLVCTYRYRQPRAGAELYHSGIVGTDGVSLSPGGTEYVQAIADLKTLRAAATPGAAPPPSLPARAALVYDVDSRWNIDHHRQTTRWDTVRHVLQYLSALKRTGAPVDVVSTDADLSAYRIVVVPAHQLADARSIAKWRAYAEGGGHLIISARTAQKDRRGHLWEGPWAAPLLDLVGGAVERYDVLPGTRTAHLAMGTSTYAWAAWAERLVPRAGTEVLGRYTDDLFKGDAAITTRPLGTGTVTYVGVESVGGELESDLVRAVAQRGGLTIRPLPPQTFLHWRDGLWIFTNFSSASTDAPAPPHARFVLGERHVAPAGVAVWKE